jgi:hypothetical protein
LYRTAFIETPPSVAVLLLLLVLLVVVLLFVVHRELVVVQQLVVVQRDGVGDASAAARAARAAKGCGGGETPLLEDARVRREENAQNASGFFDAHTHGQGGEEMMDDFIARCTAELRAYSVELNAIARGRERGTRARSLNDASLRSPASRGEN